MYEGLKIKFNDYVQTIETYIMFEIKQKAAQLACELEERNRSPISLSMGAPVQDPPEFVVKKLIEALKEPKIHTYSSPKGESYYLEAIAKRMKNRFGVTVDPKLEIFSLIGSKEGIANFLRALINPNIDKKKQDIVLIPDPGYASYKEMLKVCGGLGYSIPLNKENNYMPNLEQVIDNLKKDGYDENSVKAVIINYPNNPLGVECTKSYLKEVFNFCKRRKIILISDAAYCDMYFEESFKPISILEIDKNKEISVEFHSFSKPYAMTGWRLGWVCGNEELVSIFGKLKSTIDTGIFKPLQKAAAQVLNSKEGDEYIVKANIEFKKKQQILLKGLEELRWDIKNINCPKTTFYLWLPIPKKYKSSEEFCDALLKKSGIVVVPGTAFGKNGEGFFRVSIVCSEENLYEVINRMKEDGFYFDR